MGPIERLARDICWAEFVKKPKGKTKAGYWRGVHEEGKDEYKRDAEWLVFIVKQLKPLRIIPLVYSNENGRRSRRLAKRDTEGT